MSFINEETMSEIGKKLYELSNRGDYISKHFKRLVGKGVTQNQAAQKYDLPVRSISHWTAKGFIGVVGVPANDPTAILVDEADVAYCAAAYKALDVQPGQKLFNKDGSLYIPKGLGLLIPA